MTLDRWTEYPITSAISPHPVVFRPFPQPNPAHERKPLGAGSLQHKDKPQIPGSPRSCWGRKGRGEETEDQGGLAWRLVEVTLVDSAEGVRGNWETWGAMSSCIQLALCLATSTLSKNVQLQASANVPATLTKAERRSGQSRDAVPGSVSLPQR